MQELSLYKKQFDRKLAAFFNARLKTYNKLGKGTLVPKFIEQTKTIALAGGKRFRPYLAELAYETFGGKDRDAIDHVALGLEIFHLFALAHDDIVDKGMRRHGETTAHIFATELLLHHKRLGDIAHVGQGQGMLAGDLLLVWAEELISGYTARDIRRQAALEAFRETIDELFVGEMVDIDLSTQKDATLHDINRKSILKTARYTFVGPLRVGARLATGKKSYDAFAEKFGETLGLAYQIQDDLLDAMGAESGKSALIDVSGRQHTCLTHYLFHMADSRYRNKFAKLFGLPVSQLNAADIADLYKASGALEYAQVSAAKAFARSRNLLQTSTVIPKKHKPEWEYVINIIENRKN